MKEAHQEKFIAIFQDIFQAMWENGKDVSKPEILVEVLQQRLKEEEAQEVMAKANSPPYKQQLNDNTKEALDRGAFGCPWFSVRNSKGEEEPFFGSDRYVPFRLFRRPRFLARQGLVFPPWIEEAGPPWAWSLIVRCPPQAREVPLYI